MQIIENGEVYTPAPRGKTNIVIAGDRIEKIVVVSAIDLLEDDPELIDATVARRGDDHRRRSARHRHDHENAAVATGEGEGVAR